MMLSAAGVSSSHMPEKYPIEVSLYRKIMFSILRIVVVSNWIIYVNSEFKLFLKSYN